MKNFSQTVSYFLFFFSISTYYFYILTFIISLDNQFPRNFIQSVRVIYTRIFRIFAIIYTNHFNKLEQADAQSHLNTSFKHFLFFCWEYDLVAATELNALKDIVKELKIKYDKSCEAYNKSARK